MKSHEYQIIASRNADLDLPLVSDKTLGFCNGLLELFRTPHLRKYSFKLQQTQQNSKSKGGATLRNTH